MASRDLVIGTAGHIDHGKTALVRALTGVDTDRLPAEKQRGITIDLGFAPLDLGGDRLALVDVPGHERFIRNMLAGATGLDLALLVVAADDSVMPQTREHLEILRLLGLPVGVIALTKCDLADPTWLGLVEEDVRTLVRGTFLASAPIVRTSAATGEGIDRLRAAIAETAATAPDREDAGLFRMAIDRVFSVAGHGTVVTGTVASGRLAVGDEAALWPAGRSVRVRGLHRHERAVESVGRGSRAAVNLAGVHHTEVSRGDVLATPGYLEASRVVSILLKTADDAPRPIRHRGRYRLHVGTAEVAATVALFSAEEVRPGDEALGQALLAEPVAVVAGQPFVIREESPPTTLGGGRIVRPTGRRIRRRDHASIARVERLARGGETERIAAAQAGFGLKPWTEPALCRESGVPIGAIRDGLSRLTESGALVELPVGPRRTTRVLAETASALEDRVLRALGRLHDARPRQSTIPRSHIAAELPDLEGDALVAGLIERLKVRGLVTADGRSVALKGREPRLSQGERKLKASLAESLRAGGFTPPDAAELTASAGPARAAVVPELLTLLCDEERAVMISPQLFLDSDAAEELRSKVVTKLADGATMSMADLRDLLGTTRKYAVPIGEYLDRIGLTRRDGDLRRLAPQTTPESLTPHGRPHEEPAAGKSRVQG